MRRLLSSASPALTGATAFLIACSGSDLTLPDQGLAAKIVIVRGDPQSAPAGSQLPDSLVVRVTDSKDRPVQGQVVGFAAGAGTVVPATAATNADGRAGAVWVLGPVAGPQTATATVNGNGAPPGLVVTFHATATSSAPAKLDKTAGDGQQATAGSPVPTPPAVKVTDVGGNPVAGVAVTFTVTGGGGSVNPTTPVSTDANGVAAATTWTLGAVAGPNTLTATMPGTGITGNPAVFTATGTVGRAGKLAITQQPSAAAQSGVPFTQQPQLQIQDAQGNPVKTAGIAVAVTLASGVGGGLSGQLAVSTDANGVAAFTNLALTGPQGTYTLAFSSPTLSGVTSTAIALGAGAPAQLIIVQQPAAAAQSGVQLNPQPAVQLEDAEGNPVPRSGVAVTAVLNGPGAVLSGTKTRTTDATGKAAFTDLVITGLTGQYSLSFTSASPALAVGPSITIGLGAGAPARLIVVTPPSASVANGLVFPQQPVLQVVDGAGNPAGAAGITVRVAITTGGGTLGGTPTAVTNASGVATFAGLSITGTVGVRQLTFSTTGPSLTPATASVTVTAGIAAKLAMARQPSAKAVSGVPFAQQPQVQVQDAQGNPVGSAGLAVSVALASGLGAALSGQLTIATDANGLATFTNLGLTGPQGTYTLAFSNPTLSGATSAAILLAAGAPTQLVIVQQPAAASQSGTRLTPQPVVQLQDAQKNPVAQAGVAVTATLNGVGATLSGTSTRLTDATGKASFTDLVITGLTGQYSLSFTSASPSLASGPSNTIVLAAGPAAKLVLATPPSASVASGQVFPQQPVIQAQDASGNPAAQAGIAVTASLNGAGASLGGTKTVNTGATGTAVFTNLAITGSTGTYSITFSASQLTSATSSSITVGAGTATHLVFTQQPSNAAAGALITPAVAVSIEDGAGNVVTTATNQLTIAIATNPSGGTLSGTLTVSPVNGVATFSNLSIDKAGAGYRLSASAAALTGTTSTSFTVTAGAASQLVFTRQPSNVTAGVSITPSVRVSIEDAFGNVVTSAVNQVTVSIANNPAGGSLSGTTTISAVSGVASFGTLSIDKAGTGYTLSASSTGLGEATSAPFNVTPAAASQLVFTQQPTSVAAGGAITPAVQVSVEDRFGNLVTSATPSITIAIGTNPSGGTLSGTLTLSASGGVATFSALSIDIAGTGYTLTASGGGLPQAESSPFNVM